MIAVNPAAVTLARESRGWTQTDLAKAIGVTQGKVCKYELGSLRIADDDLVAIADALQFDRAFFEQGDLITGLGGDFLYRKRASLPIRAKRRIEAEANIRKMQVKRLLQAAQIPPCEFPFPVISPEQFDGRIDRIAQEVRRAWRVPEGPIRNVTTIIENAGGIVFTTDFESDLIDGTNLRIPGLPPMLFLNRNVSGERHRFNLAHELAHVVMHFSTSLGDAEDEANAFAREFLLPKSLVRTDLKGLDLAAAARLKSVWGVSMATIIFRAKELGQITDSTYRRLFTSMSAGGIRRVEPFPLAFEQPQLFGQLVAFHRDKLEFTDQDMRRLLFTDELGSVPVTTRPRMRIVGGTLFDSGPSDSTEPSPPSLRFPGAS